MTNAPPSQHSRVYEALARALQAEEIEIHKMRSDGISEAGAVHGRGDLAAVARAFGLRDSTVTDVAQMPALFDAFRASGGAELWDIHINDKVTTAGKIDG